MLKIFARLINFLVWFGFAILVALLLIIPFGMRLLVDTVHSPSPEVLRWLDYLHQAQFIAMSIFCFTWIFFLGGCFASFLNVVAWRVPRGKSILGSSHCPHCNVLLKFPRTNMPVLGWMKNGGRCANCEVPIPVRYLIAELVLGSTFLILFLLQTATGGATVPFRTFIPFERFDLNLFTPRADLLATLVFHLTILSLIFTLAIAATEKFPAPRSLIAFGLIAVIGFHCFSPAIGMVDFRLGEWIEGAGRNGYLNLLESPTDFLIATALGIAASAVCFQAIRFSMHSNQFGAFACLFLIGVAFGWQAVISVTALTCVLLPVVRFNVSGVIFFATLLHLCLWRMQTQCVYWPGPASGLLQLVYGIVFIGLTAAAYRYLALKSAGPTAESIVDLPITESDLE